MALYGSALPDFPWDTLKAARDQAAKYPAGEIDLTIGSPVDPAPQIAIQALQAAADAHAYPPNSGSVPLRRAIRRFVREQAGCVADIDVLPTLGEKELVALLPALLELGEGDRVAFPEVAYPTYEVGALLAGAEPIRVNPQADPDSWPYGISLLWLNSPSNPTGHVLSVEQLRAIVSWAREHGVIIASDECYSALNWASDGEGGTPSVLSDAVCGGDASGLLMLYSLSKQSNLAGYRAAFVAGDPELIAPIREVRKHSGMMLPGPVQAAMVAALGDQNHVREQRERYRARREVLLAALPKAGLECDDADEAGLYLWVHAKASTAVTPRSAVTPNAWELVDAFARIGIIVAPGTFYGSNSECESHVRISLTASDRDIRDAAARLAHYSFPAE